jgi:hypothetical protein
MKASILALAISAAALLSSCSTCPMGHEITSPSKVEHVVLIWLKKPGDQAAREQVIREAKKFQAEIREIKHLSVGIPLASERAVVDDSFDVGLVMRFANASDLSVYEKHPVHTESVASVLRPLSKKLLVYDIVTH